MRSLLLLAALAQDPAAPRPEPPPATDIHLLRLASGLASLKEAKPSPVSTAAGYDNQPMFSPDGGRILFAANHDGAQTDVFLFERASGHVSRLTETPENENSPTYLPEGIGHPGGFSVVRTEADRTQRLWRFDAQGRNPELVLPDVEPVGYHAWVDREWVALFVLGEPSTLRIANVGTGKAEIASERIGRSLHRIPGTRLVSFVHREASGDFWIQQIDVDSRKIEPLVEVVEGNTERDMAWMPDGRTILMSSGTKVFSWTREASGWAEVFDAATHRLGAVSRLAVSPLGDAIAVVVAEPKLSPAP
jgi:Tol biopolymer transport system component